MQEFGGQSPWARSGFSTHSDTFTTHTKPHAACHCSAVSLKPAIPASSKIYSGVCTGIFVVPPDQCA